MEVLELGLLQKNMKEQKKRGKYVEIEGKSTFRTL